MHLALFENHGVLQVFMFLGAGALFGFIAAVLVLWFWWGEREAVLEERGVRVRDRIRRRFRYDRQKREGDDKS